MTRSCEQREAGTDIVVRLRLEGSEVCIDGAKEIERLRECLAYARQSLVIIKGTLEDGRPDEPFSVTDAAPNTPR